VSEAGFQKPVTLFKTGTVAQKNYFYIFGFRSIKYKKPDPVYRPGPDREQKKPGNRRFRPRFETLLRGRRATESPASTGIKRERARRETSSNSKRPDPVGSASADRAGLHGVKSSPRRSVGSQSGTIFVNFFPEKYTPFPFLPCRDTRTGLSLSLLAFSVCLSLPRPRNQPLFSSPSERSSPPPTVTGRHFFPSGCTAGHLIAICRHAENHRSRGLSPPRVGGGIRHPSSSKGHGRRSIHVQPLPPPLNARPPDA